MVKHVCLHFVGFRGDEYASAVKLWGEPDFYHPYWDTRASLEVAPQDVVVHAFKDWRARPSPLNRAETLSCSQLSQRC